MMKVNIQSLKDGLHTFDFVVDRVHVDLSDDETFVNQISVHSVLDKREDNIYVKSDVRTEGQFECDRCLEPFTATIEDHFELFFTFDMSSALLDDQEVNLLDATMQEIDLQEGVRDCLLLARPMKVLCSDNCKGICPHCGTNLNENSCECHDDGIDPRWEVLKKLMA
jgi:uncharacterized protein